MNATAVATKAPSVSRKPPKTDKAAKPIVTEAQQLLARCRAVGFQVQDILLEAGSIDAANEESGNGASYRFTRLAAQTLALLEPDQAETWTEGEHAETLIDAITLIDAACDCDGDSVGAERIALYDKARAMLCSLLEGTDYAPPPRAPTVEHAQASYTRPVQTFSPVIGKTAEERLNILRATLHTADHKLEAAYDAAELGSAVDVLLDLIAHDLMCSVMSPLMRDADEADIPVTKGSIEVAHQALFPVLAALEGAMALATGTVLSATLAEAFNLLNWAQDECDSAALGALMPAAQMESDSTPATPKAGVHWLEIDRANGEVGNARVMLEMLMQEAAFNYSDPVDAKAAQSRIIVLGDATDNLLATAESSFEKLIEEMQGAAA